ncbi:MAG: class IV adenylate cyclase [Pirellulales bacterium]
MTYEVELKFALWAPEKLREQLASLGAAVGPPVSHVDTYVSHPSREFAQTDEALRLRQVGRHNWLTYKGPKVDAVSKTRREVEVSLAPGPETATAAVELLEQLGFCRVATVRKQRCPYTLRWQGWDVTVALDEVEGLGAFIELETTVPPPQVEPARAALLQLAEHFGLRSSIRESYLELLMNLRR